MGAATAILDVTVAVQVAVVPAPPECRLRGGHQLVSELVVAGPVLRLRERAQKQRGGVDGAV